MITSPPNTIAARFESPHYQLLNKIGEGGFGEVYCAKQLSTGQTVAIKFLRLDSNLTTDKKQRYIERFKRETLLGSQLDHPNIVRLLDKGVCQQDLLYGVFEYIDGITLKQHIEQTGALNPVDAANIMAQVLDALAHAHQQGIVHRDIKPANIMLRQTNNNTHVKVLDFSISAIIDKTKQQDYQTLTLTQETLGTPAYSAPEQLRGEPPTYKTDLYVWGLVFIECLTGKPAFTGTSHAAIFHQQLSPNNVPIPSSLVGHPVSTLLRRVLNKNVTERINNTSALYQQLSSINFASLVGTINTSQTQVIHQQTQVATRVDTQTMIDIQPGNTQTQPSSERKQITVLCVSIDIKTLHSDAVEQEIIDSLLDDQFTLCQDIAIRYGGFHVGTLANMVLCYFGYPNASDNDCRLAARAALEINSEINARNAMLKENYHLQSVKTIGLNTGVITQYNDQVPRGETPNIAVKLLRRAKANQILCAQSTKQQLTGYIEFHHVGQQAINATAVKQNIYAIAGERQIEAMSLVRMQPLSSSFFGRQTELTQLQNLINQQPQPTKLCSLHLYGEAGIGKSRLIFEFRQNSQQQQQIVTQCLPEQINSGLYPILTFIKQHYGVNKAAPEQSIRQLKTTLQDAKLEALDSSIALLCLWLNLPVEQNSERQALDHQSQKQQLFNALATLLYLSTQTTNPVSDHSQSILIIIEDLHWADPTTIEFIHYIHTHAFWQHSNHLLLTTSRQSQPIALADTIKQTLKIAKLSQQDSRELIANLFNQNQREPTQIADELLDILLEKTDGIPLFIEETVNMLRQNNKVHVLNGLIDIIDRKHIDQLPNNLRDTLQQKLDSLLTAKETAQIAALIGRSFDQNILAQACNYSPAQLQLNLNELLEKQLVIKQRKVEGDNYIFRHALIRDAAYDSIPSTTKQQYHQHIANILEQTKAPAHQLAYHFAGAKQPLTASHWYLQAGDKAASTFAHNEYIHYYQNTIEQLQIQQKIEPLNNQQLERFAHAYKGIGNGAIASGRHQQGRKAYQQAIDYSQQIITPDMLEQTHLTIAELYLKIAKSWTTDIDHPQAMKNYQQAEQALTKVTSQDNKKRSLEIWLNINSARLNHYYGQADIAMMQQQIDKMAAKIAQDGSRWQQAQFLHDQCQLQLRQNRFAASNNLVNMAKQALALISDHTDQALIIEYRFDYALTCYFNHQHQTAYQKFQQLLDSANQRQSVMDKTLCLNYLAICARHLNRIDQCKQFAEQTIKEGNKANLVNYIAAAKANLAWVAYKQHHLTKAEQLLQQALEQWQQSFYPMQWLALFVRLALVFEQSQADAKKTLNKSQIVCTIEKICSHKQQQLPESITQAFDMAMINDLDEKTFNDNIQWGLSSAKALGYL